MRIVKIRMKIMYLDVDNVYRRNHHNNNINIKDITPITITVY